MKNLGYYNGEYGLLEDMKIPMNDRVCWFGDGVYDAGPSRNYHIFALDEHIDRFYRNAAALDIQMPLEKSELRTLLGELVTKLDTRDNFVYYQVTRGTAIRNHTYEPGPGNLWVMIKPAAILDGTKPISLITAEDTRYYHCNIKTLNLIPNVTASQKAKAAGCQEAVFYRPGGRITECAHSNVHILKDGCLITAPTDELILPGIARAHLINACHKLNVPVVEKPYFLPELFDADEVLVTSSSNLCLFADHIDGREVGMKDHELYNRIRHEVLTEYLTATE